MIANEVPKLLALCEAYFQTPINSHSEGWESLLDKSWFQEIALCSKDMRHLMKPKVSPSVNQQTIKKPYNNVWYDANYSKCSTVFSVFDNKNKELLQWEERMFFSQSMRNAGRPLKLKNQTLFVFMEDKQVVYLKRYIFSHDFISIINQNIYKTALSASHLVSYKICKTSSKRHHLMIDYYYDQAWIFNNEDFSMQEKLPYPVSAVSLNQNKDLAALYDRKNALIRIAKVIDLDNPQHKVLVAKPQIDTMKFCLDDQYLLVGHCGPKAGYEVISVKDGLKLFFVPWDCAVVKFIRAPDQTKLYMQDGCGCNILFDLGMLYAYELLKQSNLSNSND